MGHVSVQTDDTVSERAILNLMTLIQVQWLAYIAQHAR
jgi:hypothetical protein